MGISRLAHMLGSPGRVFKLPESAIAEAIEKVSQSNDNLFISDSAGLQQLQYDGDPLEMSEDILDEYFAASTGCCIVTTQRLADFLSINRRYARSINLERDFDVPEAVEGYILTDRALDALQRMVASIFGRKRTTAWTLTGVYGTGKSSFVHFLISLVGPSDSPTRQVAMEIARQSLQPDSPEFEALEKKLPSKGLFRAFATAQREPLSHTIVRALEKGANEYWHGSSRPQNCPTVNRLGSQQLWRQNQFLPMAMC